MASIHAITVLRPYSTDNVRLPACSVKLKLKYLWSHFMQNDVYYFAWMYTIA